MQIIYLNYIHGFLISCIYGLPKYIHCVLEYIHAASKKVFAALVEDGTFDWTDEELAMVASKNLINTFRQEAFKRIRENMRFALVFTLLVVK